MNHLETDSESMDEIEQHVMWIQRACSLLELLLGGDRVETEALDKLPGRVGHALPFLA